MRWKVALTLLARLSERRPREATQWLTQALTRRLRQLAPIAIEVAQESQNPKNPIGPVLAHLLQSSPDPPLSRSLVDLLPRRSVALREAAVIIVHQAIRSLAEGEGPWDLPRIANLNNTLAAYLFDLGRPEEASAASREAVRTYRHLSKADRRFLPGLALALSTLGALETDSGDYVEAEHHLRESIDTGLEEPELFGEDLLASAHKKLGTALAGLGRREEALEETQEAASHLRKRVGPGGWAAELQLAGILSNLSHRYSDVGRSQEGLDAANEAVETFRQAWIEQADRYAERLADALGTCANRLSELNRHEEALKVMTEAVALYRNLARQRPEVFRRDYARQLNNLSNRHSHLGRNKEALGFAQTAVDEYRALCAQHPAYGPELAVALNTLARRLSTAGQGREAARYAAEALTQLRPHLAPHREDLSSWVDRMAEDSVRFTKEAGLDVDG